MKSIKLSKKQVVELSVEAEMIISSLEDQKKLYQRLDEITLLLKDQDLKGMGIECVDNFASKQTVWRACGVRRFELKRVADE